MKSDFMKHKNFQHQNNVTLCMSYNEDFCCRFGNNCWFKHEDSDHEAMFEDEHNNETTEKVFNILEEFTKRIVLLETF